MGECEVLLDTIAISAATEGLGHLFGAFASLSESGTAALLIRVRHRSKESF